MSELVSGETVTAAWLAALGRLFQHDGEVFGLVVDITDPNPARLDPSVAAELDQLLRRRGDQDVATVANTIFPLALAQYAPDRQDLYDRYQTLLPLLQRASKRKRRESYFDRLIDYPLRVNGQPINQVEVIIKDLIQEQRNGRRLRFIYEAQAFAPGRDRQPIGFPCLSSLSFQLDGEQLRLTATYRNQYYVKRALGNFLGLAHLQQFISHEAGLRQGPLTVIAFHAELDGTKADKEALAELLSAHPLR